MVVPVCVDRYVQRDVSSTTVLVHKNAYVFCTSENLMSDGLVDGANNFFLFAPSLHFFFKQNIKGYYY